MAKNVKLIAAAKRQPTVTTVFSVYTSPASGLGTRITQFSAALLTGTHTYKVFNGASAITATELVSEISITGPNQSTPATPINVFLEPGEQLFVQVSTGTTIVFNGAGIEF